MCERIMHVLFGSWRAEHKAATTAKYMTIVEQDHAKTQQKMEREVALLNKLIHRRDALFRRRMQYTKEGRSNDADGLRAGCRDIVQEVTAQERVVSLIRKQRMQEKNELTKIQGLIAMERQCAETSAMSRLIASIGPISELQLRIDARTTRAEDLRDMDEITSVARQDFASLSMPTDEIDDNEENENDETEKAFQLFMDRTEETKINEMMRQMPPIHSNSSVHIDIDPYACAATAGAADMDGSNAVYGLDMS